MHQRLDYNKIAHIYDNGPHRTKQVDADLLSFIDMRSDIEYRLRILDIGCGTGNQQIANQDHLTQAHLIGVDPFIGMLHQGRHKTKKIDWVQADGAHLPFQDDIFDFITSQFSYHHVQNKSSMISEVYRVLSSVGQFVMTNISPQNMPKALIYRYFPVAWERDITDFLPTESILDLMHQVGFLEVEIEKSPIKQKVSLKEFYESVCQRYTCSQLLVISDTDYQQGLAQIKAELSESKYGDLLVCSETCVMKIKGHKNTAPTGGSIAAKSSVS